MKTSSTLPPLSREEEAQWLEDARSSPDPLRRNAVSQLLSRLEPQVLAICERMTGHPEDGQDAAQEVLLAVHRHLPRFRGEARLSTWAFRIAIRASLELRQRRAAHAEANELDEERFEQTPEQSASDRQQWSRLMRAMKTLPPEQHAVLVLFAMQGLTHPQIAEVLGVPEGTIWSRLHGARKKLRAALAAE